MHSPVHESRCTQIIMSLKVRRGHVHMTSAKFWGFLTPPLPLVRISRNLSVLFVRKIGQFLNPPSPPQCGRLKSIAPYHNSCHESYYPKALYIVDQTRRPTCSFPKRQTGVSGMKRSMMKKGALWPASTRLRDCHSSSAPNNWNQMIN